MSLLSLMIMSTSAHAEPITRPYLPGAGNQLEHTVVGTFHDVQGEVIYQDSDENTLPTISPVIAVMIDNVRAKRTVQVMPDAKNEIRMIYERPRAVQIIDAAGVSTVPSDILAIIGDSEEEPIAYVISSRPGVRSLIVSTPDTDVEVVDLQPPSAGPLLIPDEDTVLGILTAGGQDSLKAFVQVLDPMETTVLLELHQRNVGWPWGQN